MAARRTPIATIAAVFYPTPTPEAVPQAADGDGSLSYAGYCALAVKA